jgi:hypothetical protein
MPQRRHLHSSTRLQHKCIVEGTALIVEPFHLRALYFSNDYQKNLSSPIIDSGTRADQFLDTATRHRSILVQYPADLNVPSTLHAILFQPVQKHSFHCLLGFAHSADLLTSSPCPWTAMHLQPTPSPRPFTKTQTSPRAYRHARQSGRSAPGRGVPPHLWQPRSRLHHSSSHSSSFPRMRS